MKINTPTLKAFLVASSIALAVPLVAQARPDMDERFGEGPRCEEGMRKHEGMGRHHGGPGMGMLRGLDLSDAQRDRIFELKHALAPKLRDEMKAVHASRQSLREMMDKGEYDAAKVKQLTEEGAAAKARMAQLTLQNQHEVYQLLTPEQRTKMSELREQRAERREAKREARRMEGAPVQPG
ncbi:MAG: Spy/CpxP family protein refolding chaperone [Rhodocyclaceae bacterium]|nr:Spy/CpxP family protein refolding chaperone [Rhodocyclaceae bacterium]